MLSSLKQRRFISNLISKKKDDFPWLQSVWNETPRNNEKYPDPNCNYQQVILADRLENLSAKQASYVIKAWAGEYGYHLMTARDIITKYIIKI